MSKSQKKGEQHPLFPSGEWEGFYTYAMGPDAEQHKMDFFLNFRNGIVTGGGGDDVGSFSWKGAYDTEELYCTMAKSYQAHTVSYQGNVDENGIWGTWQLNEWMTGGFHIWPKGQEANKAIAKKKQRVKVAAKSKKLKKV